MLPHVVRKECQEAIDDLIALLFSRLLDIDAARVIDDESDATAVIHTQCLPDGLGNRGLALCGNGALFFQ